MRLIAFLICLLLCPLLAATANDADASDYARGVSTLNNYFDLVLSGNIESAGYLWRQDVYERATRFGISYTGIPLKVDCNSPFMRQLDFYRNNLDSPLRQVITLEDPSYLRIEFSSNIHGQRFNHYYFAQWQGEYAWLIHAQDYVARDWPMVESEYFRVRYHPNMKQFLTPAALASADAYIVAMKDTLNLSDELMDRFREKKIEYFYCDSDMRVEEIIGHRVRGTLDLPTNDIISATFPHFHEISHLLINARLQEIPLFTLPLFREGIAVHYGGRWGKGPHALTDLGIFMHQQEIVPFDSILTMHDFSNYSGADIAYPVAGVFSGYLIDRHGTDRYLDIYRSFSAPFDQLNTMTTVDIQKKLAALVDQPDWASLMADFNSYLDTYAATRSVAKPGGEPQAKALLAGEGYSVAEHDDWLVFTFLAEPQDTVAGTLLWGSVDKKPDQLSSLFTDQFQGDRLFQGHHYAVRYDQFEVGLYDYASNQLLAKYIWGITPSDDYFDETERTVRVCFRKSLVTEMPGEDEVAFFRP